MGNWRREILCYVILVSILFAAEVENPLVRQWRLKEDKENYLTDSFEIGAINTDNSYLLSLAFEDADFVDSKKKKNSLKKPNRKETSLFNFFRLVLYRLIYGFATMFGAQEGISEFMGGIFVPPGADEGDYRDYLDGEDEDDYEY